VQAPIAKPSYASKQVAEEQHYDGGDCDSNEKDDGDCDSRRTTLSENQSSGRRDQHEHGGQNYPR
jgi:hypothetical protein